LDICFTAVAEQSVWTLTSWPLQVRPLLPRVRRLTMMTKI